MDYLSWITGYFVGVALHQHLRPALKKPVIIAAMSVTGLEPVVVWNADITDVKSLFSVEADYSGDIKIEWAFGAEEDQPDSQEWQSKVNGPLDIETFIREQPVRYFTSDDEAADQKLLWFRFNLSDGALLHNFTLLGNMRDDLNAVQ